MPSLDNRSPKDRGNRWQGIVRTFLVEVLVLVALSGAVVRYLNWSSDAAWAEFISASRLEAPAPKFQPLSAMPAEAVKGQPPCGWSA
jgi:hypothetical protein